MPLICSSANSRSSYIQSCTSVRPSACVASTVTRLTRSLGNAGHSPVVMRRMACRRRRLHVEDTVAHAALDVHALQHRGDHFDVLFARAFDGHLAAGDRGDDRPASRLDVVAAQPMLGAVQALRRPRRGSSSCRCPRHAGAHLLQELAQLDDVRLGGGVADLGDAAAQRPRQAARFPCR